jgi:hypothetical protein
MCVCILVPHRVKNKMSTAPLTKLGESALDFLQDICVHFPDSGKVITTFACLLAVHEMRLMADHRRTTFVSSSRTKYLIAPPTLLVTTRHVGSQYMTQYTTTLYTCTSQLKLFRAILCAGVVHGSANVHMSLAYTRSTSTCTIPRGDCIVAESYAK